MADPTKGTTQTFISHQGVTHPGSVFGTIIDCSDFVSVQLALKHGFIEAAANTNPGYFSVKASIEASDNDQLVEIMRFTVTDATPSQANIAGSEGVGDTQMDVGTGEESGFSAGDGCYVRDTGTEDDSEWHYVDRTATDAIHLSRGLVRAKDAADDIFSDAEQFSPVVSLDGIKRITVDFIHEGTTGANVAVEATGVFFTAFE